MNIDEALETVRAVLKDHWEPPGPDEMGPLKCQPCEALAALDIIRGELTRARETIAAWAVMIEDDDARTEAQLEQQEQHTNMWKRHALRQYRQLNRYETALREVRDLLDFVVRADGTPDHTKMGLAWGVVNDALSTPPNQEPRRPPLFPGDRAMLRNLAAKTASSGGERSTQEDKR